MTKQIDPQRIDRALKLLHAANEDYPTYGEVAKTIGQVTRVFSDAIASLQKSIKEGDANGISEAMARFTSSGAFRALQRAVNTDLPRQIDDVSRATAAKIRPLADAVSAIDRANLDARVMALENEERGEDSKPKTPESIRNALETLKGPERLTIDAIYDLREQLEALAKRIDTRGGGGAVIAYSRGQTKLYDLSDQLNGSKKTFALPSFWRVLLVQSTSTPNTFRPDVDYTTDASAMTITFTNQIDAPSTLAQGQTLTVLYAEP